MCYLPGFMPSANVEFLSNPIEFLKKNTIINYQPESHIFGKLVEKDFAKRAKGVNLSCLTDADAKVRYDLTKIEANKYVLRRLLTFEQYTTQNVVLPEWPKSPDHPIEGNYFAYLTGTVAALSDMGQVQVDTGSPPAFTFTGIMNGCSFVVTDTVPAKKGKYMCFHYQSPGSNPRFGPQGTARFPGTMRCYVAVCDYLPDAWYNKYCVKALPTTFIFLWRNPVSGELRVVAQTLAIEPQSVTPDYRSRLVQSWRVQSNETEGDPLRPYTALDHQIHVKA
ncbi:hypothetical protein [Cystobacter ferrugineus]|uniref:Uncharacterized protein n=1 Tax=Cystobacter ferrugineus TaxID=83449 RepID=A0A1L9BCS9_9BACT|nr:hypothetical protein [Cystobacter ferrugineus]OJH40036.1 hypothetical protein BON30_13285 [Cystobacter ferrugineus]